MQLFDDQAHLFSRHTRGQQKSHGDGKSSRSGNGAAHTFRQQFSSSQRRRPEDGVVRSPASTPTPTSTPRSVQAPPARAPVQRLAGTAAAASGHEGRGLTRQLSQLKGWIPSGKLPYGPVLLFSTSSSSPSFINNFIPPCLRYVYFSILVVFFWANKKRPMQLFLPPAFHIILAPHRHWPIIILAFSQ